MLCYVTFTLCYATRDLCKTDVYIAQSNFDNLNYLYTFKEGMEIGSKGFKYVADTLI
jgi:hypothetical protein